MKKLVVLIFISLSLFGANIDEFAKKMNYERDFKAALEKAKEEDKPLMMVLGADYCPWCRKFERKTLSSKKVNDFVQSELIPLVVDKKYDIQSFPKEFQTQITPRVFFINPHTAKSFSDTLGYIKRKDFLQEIQHIKKQYKKK